MFHSLLVFWLIVADPFLVTEIGASLWELFAETVNLTEVCVLHTPPVNVRVEQIVAPCKLSWMISINATTGIYLVKKTQTTQQSNKA